MVKDDPRLARPSGLTVQEIRQEAAAGVFIGMCEILRAELDYGANTIKQESTKIQEANLAKQRAWHRIEATRDMLRLVEEAAAAQGLDLPKGEKDDAAS